MTCAMLCGPSSPATTPSGWSRRTDTAAQPRCAPPGRRRPSSAPHNAAYCPDSRVQYTIASHHYAFHVSEAEFDAILQRVKAAGLAFGSTPWSLEDGKLNDWNGGRGVYFKDPDGHVLELMTVPQ